MVDGGRCSEQEHRAGSIITDGQALSRIPRCCHGLKSTAGRRTKLTIGSAYADGLKAFHADKTRDVDENLRRASSAMKTLCVLSVASSEDARLCLTLGMVLALYIYGAVGVDASDICHYSLSAARPYIGPAASVPETEPQLIFLVLLETMDYMYPSRETDTEGPIIRSGTRGRHLGLCLLLLPYYYDLCAISHSLIDARNADLIFVLHQHLRRIQAAVNAWQTQTNHDEPSRS